MTKGGKTELNPTSGSGIFKKPVRRMSDHGLRKIENPGSFGILKNSVGDGSRCAVVPRMKARLSIFL